MMPNWTASRSTKSVRFDAVADRARRRGAAGLHLRHHGRAEGDDAFPPRPADHRRRLCAAKCCGVTPEDVFVGSPPLAFTFGLGGLAVFPLRFGAAAALLEQASPPNMIEIIQNYRATVCFTAPTAYRVMLKAMDGGRRPVLAARRRQRGRNAARAGLRGMDRARPASRCWTASARPRCCTSSSPTASTTTARPAPAGR